MYQITMYLGEVPEGGITIRIGDSAILEATCYNADGTAFLPEADWDYDSYTAELIVRRSEDDSAGQIEIVSLSEATILNDNIYYFDLTDIAFEQAVYECFIRLTGTNEDFTTPTDEVYSFEIFTIRVEA